MQIDKLKKEVDLQLKEKGSLESRAAEAENRMLESKLKLEKVSLYHVFDVQVECRTLSFNVIFITWLLNNRFSLSFDS